MIVAWNTGSLATMITTSGPDMGRHLACSLEFMRGRCPVVCKLCAHSLTAASDQPLIKTIHLWEAYYSSSDVMLRYAGLSMNDSKAQTRNDDNVASCCVME